MRGDHRSVTENEAVIGHRPGRHRTTADRTPVLMAGPFDG